MRTTPEDRPERPNITGGAPGGIPGGIPGGVPGGAPGMAEIAEFLAREFPQSKCRVLEVGAGGATVAHEVGAAELRPGGTVSGPVLMAIADVGLYVALLGEIGIVPLAVTTNLTINFLRKPAADKRIVGVCRLIKVGKVQAVGEVHLYSEGAPEVVAHAVGTYSIPKMRGT